jgi:SnoaL-like domain/Activator of Hsp90 ATPase homolog 1-like protein
MIGYAHSLTVRASADEAFDAIAQVGGIRAWWSPIAAGVAEPGGQLALGFDGLDEAIVLRVDEMARPQRVAWTCLRHTSAPGWDGSRITFDIRTVPGGSTGIELQHHDVDAAVVADGWTRFLDSLASLLDTGTGRPYAPAQSGVDEALRVARAYHAAWTAGDHRTARRLLADDLVTDVPLHRYSGGDDFAAAVQGFGALAERVDVLSEFGAGDEALLVYDMRTRPFGVLRVAEQFTVRDGVIRRIRHVHDTAALRAPVQ